MTAKEVRFKKKLANAISYQQTGKIKQAESIYKYLIDKKYYTPSVFLNLGVIKVSRGKYKEAKILFSKVLRLNPKSIDGLNNLANILFEEESFYEAKHLLLKALAIDPKNFNSLNNLGNVYFKCGDYEPSLKYYRKALDIRPHTDIYSNMGNVYLKKDQPKDAISCYKIAFDLSPNNFSVACNLFYCQMKHGDYGGIEHSLLNLHKKNPENIDLLNCLSTFLFETDRFEEAKVTYHRSLEIKHAQPNIHNNLGNLYKDLEENSLAIKLYKSALNLDPGNVLFVSNLATLYKDLNEPLKAIAVYEKYNSNQFSISNMIDYWGIKLSNCDWNNYEHMEEMLIEASNVGLNKSCSNIHLLLSLIDNPILHHRVSTQHCISTYTYSETSNQVYPMPRKNPRVAFLSSDFREHPLAYLLVGMLEELSKSNIETFGISFGNVKDNDNMRSRIKSAFNHFYDFKNRDFDSCLEFFNSLDLDLAIDLSGHTAGNRLDLFSKRIAPIQAHFMGYPSCIGANFIDYNIVDDISVPNALDQYYLETPLRLPESYWCAERPNFEVNTAEQRKISNLPSEGFVFCCFNKLLKIHPETFSLWMEILHKVPKSVLWLISENESAIKNLKNYAKEKNINPDRLIFADFVPHQQHLKRLVCADLFLDTLPCNAHTTASDAISMNVPVLTRTGKSQSARVCSSINYALGINELVVSSAEDYIEKAIYLSNNPDDLIKIKQKLAYTTKSSSVFNVTIFTKHFHDLISKITNKK